METIDFVKIHLLKEYHARKRKGRLTNNKRKDMSTPVTSLNRIAMPVASPSRKPFGRRNTFRLILASKTPTEI